MRITTGFALVVFLSFTAMGCSTSSQIARGSGSDIASEALEQEALVLRTQRDRSKKLSDLYRPLRTANADICGDDVSYTSGFFATEISAFERPYRQAATQKLGITEKVSIYYLTNESPAERSGLQVGDVIQSVNGEAIGTGSRAVRKLSTLLMDIDSSYSLEVVRGAVPLSINVTPELGCSYDIYYDGSDAINAYADGNAIYITAGMYRFSESDQELQVVIAHELAHNSEGHIDKKLGNTALGAIFDIAAAAYGVNTQGAFSDMTSTMFSQEFEREADYVGMYMLARAGVPTDEAANLWRRMAAESGSNIRGTFSASHPSSSERYTNLDAANVEIRAKISSGAALLPARKE
jgi:hypothetical protein